MATIPVAALSHLHMDPEHPVPGKGDGLMLAELPAEAVDAWAAAVPGSSLLSVEVRHLGGELARRSPEHGALDAYDAEFVVFAVGITPTPESVEVVEADIRRVQEALAPWDVGRTYLNFSERATSGQRLFGAGTYHRLARGEGAVRPGGRLPLEPPDPARAAGPARGGRKAGAAPCSQRMNAPGRGRGRIVFAVPAQRTVRQYEARYSPARAPPPPRASA